MSYSAAVGDVPTAEPAWTFHRELYPLDDALPLYGELSWFMRAAGMLAGQTHPQHVFRQDGPLSANLQRVFEWVEATFGLHGAELEVNAYYRPTHYAPFHRDAIHRGYPLVILALGSQWTFSVRDTEVHDLLMNHGDVVVFPAGRHGFSEHAVPGKDDVGLSPFLELAFYVPQPLAYDSDG